MLRCNTSTWLEISLISYSIVRFLLFSLLLLLCVGKNCVLGYLCVLNMKVYQRLSVICSHLKYLLIYLIKMVLFRCRLRLLPSSSINFVASFLLLAMSSVCIFIALRRLPLMMTCTSGRVKGVVLYSHVSLGLFDVEVELLLLNFLVCVV